MFYEFAVKLCYRPQPLINETKRIEFLFELFNKYTGGMFGEKGKKNKSKKLAPSKHPVYRKRIYHLIHRALREPPKKPGQCQIPIRKFIFNLFFLLTVEIPYS